MPSHPLTPSPHLPILPPPPAIILFDSLCNFCSRGVRFVMKRDKNAHFRFAPLQSDTARRELARIGINFEDLPDSVVVIEDNHAYTNSAAALRIARRLKFPWSLLALLRILPPKLLDPPYRAFAARRYRWFGRRDTCSIPTPQERARFLE